MRARTRASEIYAAVHGVIMDVRIALYREWSSTPGVSAYRDKWDVLLAEAMGRAANAAVEAWKRPLRVAPKRRKKRR